MSYFRMSSTDGESSDTLSVESRPRLIAVLTCRHRLAGRGVV